MPTDAEIKKADRESKERIAAADRESRERMNREKISADLISGVIPKGSFKLNDYGWYNKVEQPETVNSGLSTFDIYDSPNSDLDNPITVSGSTLKPESVSSVSVVDWVSTIGPQAVPDHNDFTATEEGPISFIIGRVKTQLSKRNSRIDNYQNDVVGRYLYAALDCCYLPLKKIKTALDVYTVVNPRYPDLAEKLIFGLGFDYTDFASNVSNYRELYAKYSVAVNESVPIINDMALIHRHLYLEGLILRDGETSSSQYILFSCHNLGQMTNDDDIIRFYPAMKLTYATMQAYLKSNVNVLQKGSTWKSFIRDLRGGMDESSFYNMPTDPDALTADVGYADEVRNQFHNMELAPVFTSARQSLIFESLDIYGDTNEYIRQGATQKSGSFNVSPYGVNVAYFISTGSTAPNANNMANLVSLITGHYVSTVVGTMNAATKVFNQYSDFDKESIMVGTRNSALGRAITTAGSVAGDYDMSLARWATAANYEVTVWNPLVCGTEVMLSMRKITNIMMDDVNALTDSYTSNLLYRNADGKYAKAYHRAFEYDVTWASVGSGIDSWRALTSVMANRIAQKGMLSSDSFMILANNANIDWFPITFVCTTSAGAKYNHIGELDVHTTFSSANILRLHTQAALSEVSIPSTTIKGPLS